MDIEVNGTHVITAATQGPPGIQGLKGDQGERGIKGDTGDQGIQGLKGDQGDKGDTGATGATGATGTQGPQGPVTAVATIAGTTSPYTVPDIPSGSGNRYITIPATDSLNTHVVQLPSADVGTVVTILNTGTATPYIKMNSALDRIRPGELKQYTKFADNWHPTSTLALPLGQLASGDSFTMYDGQEYLYWSGNAGATINFSGEQYVGRKITVANYGGNSVTVKNGGNVRNVAGDITLPSGGIIVIEVINSNYLFLASQYPSGASSTVPAMGVTGVLTSAQLPSLDASKITTGVLDPARIPAGISSGASLTTANEFTAPQILKMGPTSIPGYTAFGDSITNGSGATTPAKTFAAILGLAFGSPYSNLSLGGDEACDLSLKVHKLDNPLPTNNPLRSIFIGHNDVEFQSDSGAIAGTLARYNAALLASAAFCALPNTSKVFGQNSTMHGGHATLTGTFAANPSLPGNLGAMAATGTANGDTVTISLTTTKANQGVYVAWYGIDGDGGSASVKIDGTTVDTLLTQGPGGTIATINGATTAVFGARYVIPLAGTHSIVLTITSATASGNSFTFLWAATQNPHVAQPGEPRVFVLDPVYNGGMANSTITDQYIAIVGDICTKLVSDGLLVQHCVTNNFVVNALGMSGTAITAPDGTAIPASTAFPVHPNDYGHQEIANMVLSYAQPTFIAGTPALVYPIVGNKTQLANGGDQMVFVNGTTLAMPPLQISGEAHYIYNFGTNTVTLTGLHAGVTNTTMAPNTGALVVENGGWWRLF